MDKKQEAFLLELLAEFKIEAAEHHQAIISGLLELEKDPAAPVRKTLTETVFREIHSLKGAARAVNQGEIERLCQAMEGVFHLAKQETLTLSAPMYDVLYKVVDALGVLLSEVDTRGKSIGANRIVQLTKQIEVLLNTRDLSGEKPAANILPDAGAGTKENTAGPAEKPIPMMVFETPADPVKPGKVEKPVSTDTVRISTAKLGVLLREAEEFISAKATLGYLIKEIAKTRNREMQPVVKELEQFNRSMARMIDDHLIDIKTTLLSPFSTILEIVPKIVRDLEKSFDKQVVLTIQGEEVEIDRRILEEMKDPLIHLIRNCIDHGLETPDARARAGKTAAGSLVITIKKMSGLDVELLIRDDGAGINRSSVLQSALKMGIVTGDSALQMTDKEIFPLIFRSGISTSSFVTDISGRGLGMAIVAEKISKLGGSISVDSSPGQWTLFNISLPVTLSTFRGILVSVSEQMFIIPTTAVEKAVRVRQEEVKSVGTKQIFIYNDESLALVKVGDVLGIPARKSKQDDMLPMPVLILAVVQKRIAFVVDEVLGEHEGMVKTLGPQLVHLRNISGATILGNGRIIPILNIPELMESAAQVRQNSAEPEALFEEGISKARERYILIAEDSITLRALLRNIVESAGYIVKTAVDGMEAFQFLKNETFDLVVSDVEMPRMNGFDLTVRIRSEKRLSGLPVILVTALDSPDDRQRGMEAGANAYIVKSSFEQSNLLEMIKRLV